MTIYNIAIWGLGNHAINRILPSLSKVNELCIVGVCSRNKNIVNQQAEKWGCFGWTNSNDMLNNPSVDIIYIAVPIGIHYSFSEQAIKAGKHVWCEKPLTCSYEQTKNLVALAEKHNRAIFESFMYLHHNQFHRVQKFVNNTKKLNSVVCRFGIPRLDTPGFRNDPKLGGGAFWDVASYPISAIFALFYGQDARVLFSDILHNDDSKVDNLGRALVRFSGGISAYLEWGVGLAYKNEIDLWSENESFYTDKIFSKPEDYIPIYYERNLNGEQSIENGDKCEQFIEMFKNFIKMLDDEFKSAFERKMILGRAKLMDDIINFKE
ncbi:Gfo/Idh/MocA family oxidoreductase [Candidatus Thioglobus sp.]|nr:Gfo/Idh/MocA family oxidoreductase [Candidatus Thioglobus sp.]